MPSEESLDVVDSFYKDYSGYKCIYVNRSLFHEKQQSGYSTIERGLIDVCLKLMTQLRSDKEEQKKFFDKYAVRYNEKLKLQNEKVQEKSTEKV